MLGVFLRDSVLSRRKTTTQMDVMWNSIITKLAIL